MSTEKPEDPVDGRTGGTGPVDGRETSEPPAARGVGDGPAVGASPGGGTGSPPGGPPSPECAEEEEPSRAPKVFGVFHLVLGGLSILAFATILILGFVMRHSLDRVQMDDRTRVMLELSQELENITAVRVNGYLIQAVTVILTGLLIAAGVYLLKKRKRGRTLSLAYAVGNILFGISQMAFHEIVMKSHYARLLVDSSSIDPAMQSVIMKWYSVQTFALGCCCCFVYPVLILVCMLPERFGKNLK
jgi:hypothetical protein